MHRGLKRIIVIIAMVLSSMFAGSSSVRAGPPPALFDHGHVFFVRGLGNVFSLGMDRLAGQLRAQGVATSIRNHLGWPRYAEEIAAEYASNPKLAPVIIIGHSLGANAALGMARYLADRGVPIRLLVIFDATADIRVASNVEEVLNLYNSEGPGARLTGVAGFHGRILNDDVLHSSHVGHMNIDEDAGLHALVVAKVLDVLSGKPGAYTSSISRAPPPIPSPRARPSKVQ